MSNMLEPTGGRGDNVHIIDLENGWNMQHEDLSKLQKCSIIYRFIADLGNVNHGTAVWRNGLRREHLWRTGIVPMPI